MGDKSITYWINQQKTDDSQAQSEVCKRLWKLVVSEARKRLQARGLGADAEDVAVSVFDSYFRRTANGQFAAVANGNDLRELFLAITRNKSLERLRNVGRKKRGGDLRKMSLPDDVQSKEPRPDVQAEWKEQWQWFLQSLDEGLRTIALMRLDGLTVPTIAELLVMPERAVERKLAIIRDKWSKLGDSNGAGSQPKDRTSSRSLPPH